MEKIYSHWTKSMRRAEILVSAPQASPIKLNRRLREKRTRTYLTELSKRSPGIAPIISRNLTRIQYVPHVTFMGKFKECFNKFLSWDGADMYPIYILVDMANDMCSLWLLTYIIGQLLNLENFRGIIDISEVYDIATEKDAIILLIDDFIFTGQHLEYIIQNFYSYTKFLTRGIFPTKTLFFCAIVPYATETGLINIESTIRDVDNGITSYFLTFLEETTSMLEISHYQDHDLGFNFFPFYSDHTSIRYTSSDVYLGPLSRFIKYYPMTQPITNLVRYLRTQRVF